MRYDNNEEIASCFHRLLLWQLSLDVTIDAFHQIVIDIATISVETLPSYPAGAQTNWHLIYLSNYAATALTYSPSLSWQSSSLGLNILMLKHGSIYIHTYAFNLFKNVNRTNLGQFYLSATKVYLLCNVECIPSLRFLLDTPDSVLEICPTTRPFCFLGYTCIRIYCIWITSNCLLHRLPG